MSEPEFEPNAMPSQITKLVILAPAMLLFATPCLGQAATLQDRFVAEAPQGWEAYRQRAKRLQGKIVWNTTQHQPWKEMTRRILEFKQAPDCALWLRQEFPPEIGRADIKYSKGGTLDVTNGAYGFRLRRTADGRPWTVYSVDVAPDHAETSRAPSDIAKTCGRPVSLGWTFDGPPPGPGVPGFQIKSVSPVTRQGAELAKVEFTYRPQGVSSYRVPTLFEGWVLLDPVNFWVLREDDLQVTLPSTKQGPMVIAQKYEYKMAAGSFPVLVSISGTTKVPDTSYDGETTYEFDLRLANLPESEFQLSAFGFSEPAGTERRGFAWYVPVGIVGVALVVVAVLLRVWLRRRRTA